MASSASEAVRAGDAADIARYKESAGLRMRFRIWRGVSVFALIYMVNVVFNAIALLLDDGISGLFSGRGAARVLLLDGLTSTARQLPTLVGSVAGFILIAILLVATARLRHAHRKRSYQRDLLAFRRNQMAQRRIDHPHTVIDDEAIQRWVEEDMRKDPEQRMANLEQIKKWFAHDELLVEWTALEISRRRFRRDVVLSVIAAVCAVIITRTILLLI
jgi:hypothetical protein